MPVFVNADPTALRHASSAGVFGATTEFLRNRIEQLSNVGAVSKEYMQKAWSLYDQVHGSDMMRQIRSISQQFASSFQVDGIKYLQTLGDFQQATLTMQRFVMAQPDIRRMYLEFAADGYSETYVNVHGDVVGEEHSDYRLVMNGMLQEDDDGELFFRYYFEEQSEEDPVRLTPYDQFDILNSWDNLKCLITKGKEDPTSIYCDQF